MGTNYIYINDLGASDELWCKKKCEGGCFAHDVL